MVIVPEILSTPPLAILPLTLLIETVSTVMDPEVMAN
jgi:hypothetical protein